jgi:dipeptidyl aminopeptidase/acylaminoacyl peptidase
LQLWEAHTGRPSGTLGHHNPCGQAAFSSDGSLLVSGESWDNTIRFWSVATGKEAHSFPEAHRFSLSPNGRLLASVNYGGRLRLREVATGRELWQTKQYPGNPDSLAFSPDGKILAWACQCYDHGIPNRHDLDTGPFVVLWDAATGRELHRLPCEEPLWSLAFSPDKRTLAAAGEKRVQLWDVPSGQKLIQLDAAKVSPRYGYIDQSRALAFSPDGRSLAAASAGDAIRLWEVVTGREYRVLTGHAAKITSLAFGPDGRTLVSGSEDTTALVWDLTPPGWGGSAALPDWENLWADLADADPCQAHRAVWSMAAEPAKAVAVLKQRLRPAPGAKAEEIRRFIAGLDHDDFTAREKASQELAALGTEAEPALREALNGQPSVEVASRVGDLLRALPRRRLRLSAAELQQLRALQVLEQIGTPEAKDLLEHLAGGAAGARQTQEAKASLDRLTKR